MLILACVSLSGGQGKTTTSIFLGRTIAGGGHRVLMIDADPQSSLTFYLGHEVQPNQPTRLEVLKKQVPVEDGIYEAGKNLWLIPSDDALDNAQDFLSGSGMGAVVLGKRLKEVADLFSVCIIRHLRKCSKAFIDRLLAGQMPPTSFNAFNDFIRITDGLRAKFRKILA
ncbi:MAG TPA: AAA family ATPase, partial [Leptolyngbyaceae cyanobacterium]